MFVPFVWQVQTLVQKHLKKNQETVMTQTNASDVAFYCLTGLVAIFFLILIIAATASFAEQFSRELRRLNIEINRTTGFERSYWMRKRRRLWLSLLPFVKY